MKVVALANLTKFHSKLEMSFIVTMTQYGAGRTPVDVATRPSVVFLVDLLMRLEKKMYD
jgi:hypothetical protein